MIYRNVNIELVKQGSKLRLKVLPDQAVGVQYVKCSRKTREIFEVGTRFCVDLEEQRDAAGRRHLRLRSEVLNQLNLFDD